MSQLTDVRSAPAVPERPGGPTLARGARRLIVRLSTDNPFYVMSALLVLLGLWRSFGSQTTEGQTLFLMCGLAGYTLLLAVPACLLVRLGGVWEDVRTVLLVVVLMFLATSVTFDETLARRPDLGVTCGLAGLLFAAGLSEVMLRGMRLRLRARFHLPYLLSLALFFLYPLALTPWLDRPRSAGLEWGLYGFGVAAALVTLTLIPAARAGSDYLRRNGSPWAWPWYPWALFVFLGAAAAARSFLLCWSMQHVERADPERLIFGTYFLAPLAFAVGALLIELGKAGGHRGVLRAGMLAPVVAIGLSAFGHRDDDLYREFMGRYLEVVNATPLCVAVCMSLLFYVYAILRRVPGAAGWTAATLAAVSAVDPWTTGPSDLVTPRTTPLAVAAVLCLGLGVARRSPWRCLAAVGLTTLLVLTTREITLQGGARYALAYHTAALGFLAVGAAFRGGFAEALRDLGVTLVLPGVGMAAVRFHETGDSLSFAYIPIVAVSLGLYGRACANSGAKAVAGVVLSVWLAAAAWRSVVAVRRAVPGLDSIVLGLVLLAVAQFISMAKAGLLPGGPGKSRPRPDRHFD